VPNKIPDTSMSDEERGLVEAVAKLYGITEEEAHDCLAKTSLARRVRKRTGKAPAKVYSIRRK
jgi:hypothetical protein